MSIRTHVAQSGKHEGDYVPCHAEKHCRIAGGSQHVIFNGSKEMNAYNTMSSMAPEFADGSRLEYAVSGYDTGSGGFRGVRGDGLDLDKAYNDTRRISTLLKNGQPMVDPAQYGIPTMRYPTMMWRSRRMRRRECRMSSGVRSMG